MAAEHTKDAPQAPLVPPVPLTIDGSAILHQMFRIRWQAWKALSTTAQQSVVEEATGVLTQMEQVEQDEGNKTALFSQLGHKGDLMLVHFRPSFDELNAVELRLANMQLMEVSGTNDVIPVHCRARSV